MKAKTPHRRSTNQPAKGPVRFGAESARAALAAVGTDAFKKFADLFPIGIFRTDVVGRRIYVNPCWSRITGLKVKEAEGDGWLNAIHPEDRPRVRSDWERALRERRPFHSEYRLQKASGSITWVVSEAVADLDAAGELTGFLGTTTDITEFKLAEEASRINDLFRLAFGFAPHGMALTEPGGRFLHVNQFLCQMLGYTESELLGLRFQDICHPDELDASIAGARDLIESRKQLLELENRYLRKDNGLVWVHLRKSLVRNDAGEPFYFVSHMQDISERKRAEAALRESEERYRSLVEVSPDGILIHNETKIVFVNPAAVKILGARSTEQFTNVAVLDLVHPDSRDVVRERIRALLEGTSFQPFLREKLIRLDGKEVPVECAGVKFIYEGKPAIQVIIRDITQTLKAEEERNRLFREVETARDRLQSLSNRLVEVQEQERRRIALELHDEIGQELTALRLNIEQSGSGHSAKAQANRKEAQTRVQKLLKVVRQISLDLRPTMLDDLGLLPALLWQFDRYTALSQIEVQFKHFGIEGRRFAPQVETAAYRIVQEALTNVLRHSGVKKLVVTVWLFEADPKSTLSIQVEDSGAGFNVDAALSAASTGLSGMRERASLLGGNLRIESTPGKGTCVMAEIPVEMKSQ